MIREYINRNQYEVDLNKRNIFTSDRESGTIIAFWKKFDKNVNRTFYHFHIPVNSIVNPKMVDYFKEHVTNKEYICFNNIDVNENILIAIWSIN